MKNKIALSTVLISILLMNFVFVSSIMAEEQTQSADTVFYNVTVDTAYDMMTKDSFPGLVVLDVRSKYEYDMGHLYGAVLIPYDELETSEFEENDEIIVYCRSGYRSAIASQILASRNFTKVYNMLGGILAWIDADYPIYTTFHHVTADIVDEEILLQIEPLLLHQTGCVSCAQNQTCPSGCEPTNIQSTVLEEEENRTVTLVTYEINGTTFEVTIANTLLWSYEELTDEANGTASFNSIEITANASSMQFYSLSYSVRHTGYNFTLSTWLTPLNSETYNASFTVMNYVPAGKSQIISLEFVKFDSSVTLSQKYAVLGKVAKEMGKVYEKSGDETLAQLAQNYYRMKDEAKYLSKLVEEQLQEYDKEIVQSIAFLIDACTFECFFDEFGRCLGEHIPYDMAICVWTCVLGCIMVGPLYPACLWPCIEIVCAIQLLAEIILCVVQAILFCGCLG